MKIILASNNHGKLVEMKEILSTLGAEILSQGEAGFSLEVEETGTTFEENAFLKAKAVCEALGEIAIADDSGLVVEALNGEPGVYSARYGGDACRNDLERTALLLENMEGEHNRNASFVSCIVCCFPNGDTIYARGQCNGIITKEPRGSGGFGYDPVFEFVDRGMTMAEISAHDKNAISHRGAALKIFESKLREYYADK